MKPRVFVGSSVEGLDVAYAIQSNLDHDAEVTVWDQGIFAPSKYTLESMLEMVEATDFGVFVFTPDDVVKIRKEEHRAVRDNVLFELGIFIGNLGRERSFIILPQGIKDFHLPSDLLGLTSLKFNPNRQDKNLRAALGPATNELRKVFGLLRNVPVPEENEGVADSSLSEADIISIIESWMGHRDARLNTQVIRFVEVDRELNLPPGSAEKYIKPVAR